MKKDPAAVALAYKHDATKVDAKANPTYKAGNNCLNCQFYQGKDAGACPMVGGKLVAAGLVQGLGEEGLIGLTPPRPRCHPGAVRQKPLQAGFLSCGGVVIAKARPNRQASAVERRDPGNGPLATVVQRLDQVPQLIKRLGAGVDASRIRPWKRTEATH